MESVQILTRANTVKLAMPSKNSDKNDIERTCWGVTCSMTTERGDRL
jgi:hypothetical protein